MEKETSWSKCLPLRITDPLDSNSRHHLYTRKNDGSYIKGKKLITNRLEDPLGGKDDESRIDLNWDRDLGPYLYTKSDRLVFTVRRPDTGLYPVTLSPGLESNTSPFTFFTWQPSVERVAHRRFFGCLNCIVCVPRPLQKTQGLGTVQSSV